MSDNGYNKIPGNRLRYLLSPVWPLSFERSPLRLQELEDRVLLSATPLAVVQQTAQVESTQIEPVQITQAEQSQQLTSLSETDSYEQLLQSSEFDFGGIDAPALIQELEPQSDTLELVFIDESVTDSEQLIRDLKSSNGSRHFEVIRIDATANGIEQITDALSNYSNVDAIHIVSHGEQGSVRLGSTWLSLASLDQHASALGTWSGALSQEADILFYGCDFAENESGQTLIEAISLLTQADVAASNNDTGTALLGGDWDLEFRVGELNAGIAFTESAQSEWKGLLATQSNVVFFADSSAGTINRLNFDGSVTVLYSGLGTNGPTAVEVNHLNGKLYWTNTAAGTISSANMDGSGGVDIVISGENNPIGLAIDPYNGKLYWTEIGPDKLQMADLDGGNKTTLLTSVKNPQDIEIDLVHGQIYWIESGSTIQIAKADTNGYSITNVTPLITTGLSSPSGLVLDVSNNRMYWTDNAAGTIKSSDLNGDNVTTVISGLDSPADIEIDTKTQRLYWTSDDGSNLQSSSVFGSDLKTESSGASGAAGVAFSSAMSQLLDTNERRVPTYNVDLQETSRETRGSGQAVAMDAAGNYVVVWSSGNATGIGTQDGSGWGVFGQRYNSDGQSIGINFRVNSLAAGNQRWASVAMNDEGYFAVAWTSSEQDGSGEGVYTRIFGPDGTALTGDIKMNTGTYIGRQSNPAIEMSNTGEIFVAWEGSGAADSVGIYGRRIDIDGMSIDATEFLINSATPNNQYDVSVDYHADGSLIAAWDDPNGVHFRRFNADGTALDAVQVTVDGAITAGNTDVAFQPNGDLIVTWRDTLGDDTLYARRYHANGTPVAAKFVVSNTTVGNQIDSSIAVAADGKFIIAWQGNGSGDSSGVFARKFAADGTALSGEFVLSQTTSGQQSKVSLAVLDIDNFVAVWTHEVSATDTAVFARQFGTAPPPEASLFFSTLGSGSGAPGLTSWTKNDVLQFGAPNFSLGEGMTSGEVMKLLGLFYSDDGDANLDALHYVTREITLGTNSPVTLKAGDLLFSYAEDETFSSGPFSFTLNKGDIIRYSPINEGGIGTGSISVLFNGIDSLTDPDFAGFNDIRGFTLVETRTQIGDVIVEAGDFLYTRNGVSVDNDIYVFHTLEAGVGTTAGTTEILLEGDDVGISHKIVGLHLVSSDLAVGGKRLTEGTLLLTLDGDGDVVGTTSPVTVNRQDIVALNLTNTTLGSGTAIGTAEILLDGSMIGLDTNGESIDALSLLNLNQLPTATDDAFTVNEDSLFNSTSGALLSNDNDPDSSSLSTGNLNTTGTSGVVTLSSDGTFTFDPNGEFESLAIGQTATTTFSYTIYDGSGGEDTATVTLTIEGRNDAPLLDNSATLILPEVVRHNGNPAGMTVAELLAANGTDVIDDIDLFDPEGIAVIGVDNMDGNWQFSLNGTSWTNFGSVTTGSAVLLGTDAYVRFVPNPGSLGTSANIQFVAWDKSVGLSGNVNFDIDTFGFGGASAFGLNTGNATMGIIDVAIKPVGVNDAYTVDEDTTLNVTSDWWDVNWSSRRTLTFNNTTRSEDLIDFPILVKLDATRIDYTKTQANGEDLRFVDASGNVLDYEIESWNSGGTSYVWVKVPQITANSGADFIDMYYENASASDAQNAANLWDDGNELVYHLNEDPGATGAIVDSTGNFHGTNVGSQNTINGVVGSAQTFNGSDQSIRIGNDLPLVNNVDAITLSSWVYSDDITQTADIVAVSRGASSTTSQSRAAIEVIGSNIRVIARGLDSTLVFPVTTNTNPLIQGEWQLITAVIDYTDARINIYVNGDLVLSQATILAGPTVSTNAYSSTIGVNTSESANYFNGRIDEVRIITGEMSADWVNAQYASMTDTLTSFSAEQRNQSVLGNDSDPNGDEITAVLNVGPANAAAFQLFADGTFNYTPTENFHGTDTFTYHATDGTNSSNIVTVTITVNSVNDIPVINNNRLNINEGATVTLTATDLEVTDADQADSALTFTVTSVNNGMFVNQVAPTTAIASFTMQDIRDGEIRFVHNGTETAPAYTLSVTDGITSIGPNTATITFFNINDTPAITAPTSVTSAKNGSVIFSAGGLNAIVLADQDALAGIMRVELSGLNGTITLGNAAVVNVISDTGTNVFIEGTLANLTDAIDGLIFSPVNGFSGTATLQIFVNDYGNTGGAPLTATRSISIVVSNTPPTANAGGPYTINEGDSLVLDGSGSSDPTGDPLTYRWDLNNNGTYGDVVGISPTIAWSVLRTLITTDGVHTIGLQVDDGDGGVHSATAQLTITNLNPVANNNSGIGFRTDEDTVFNTSNVLLNDSDPGNDTITYLSHNTTGTLGTVTHNGDGTFSYDPNGAFDSLNTGEQATDTFSYTISDGQGGTSTATVTITIQGVNDAPILGNNTLTLSEGETIVLALANLSGDDADDLNNDLSFSVSGIVAGHFENNLGLTVTTFTQQQIINGEISFIHNGSETPPAFLVSVSDGVITTTPVSATINFTNLNDAPILVNNTLTLSEGATVTLTATDLEVTDADQADSALTFTVTSISNGMFVNQAAPATAITSFTMQEIRDGEIRFVHNGSETAPAFLVSVSDGVITTTPIAATINFTNLNDAPILVHNTLTLSEGETVTLTSANLEVTDADHPESALTFTVTTVSNGMFVNQAAPTTAITLFTMQEIRDGEIRFVHNGNETAPAYTLSVSDGITSIGPNAATIHFFNINDAPTISLIPDQTIIENGASSPISFTVSDVETNDGDLSVTATSTDQTLIPNANIVVSGTGTSRTIMITPQSGYSGGPVTITLTVSDGSLTAERQFMVSVTSIDVPPVIQTTALNVFENQPAGTSLGFVNAFDLDAGEVLNWSIVGGTGQTTFILNSVTGEVTTTSRLNFESMSTYTLNVRVTDSTLLSDTRLITISVLNLNDAPVAHADRVTVAQGNTIYMLPNGVLLNDTDQDGNTLSAQLVSSTSFGTLVFNSDGSFSYETGSNYQATDSFSYRVFDGTTTSDPVTVQINITAAGAPLTTSSDPGSGTTTQFLTVPDSPTSGNNTPGETGTTQAPPGANGSNSSFIPGVPANSPTSEDDDQISTVAFVQPALDPLAFLLKTKDKERPDSAFVPSAVVRSEDRDNPESTEQDRVKRSLDGISFETQQSIGTFRYTLLTVQQLQQALSSQEYQSELDQLEKTLESDVTRSDFIKGSVAAGASSTFTIGYVLWTLRGGILLTSLLAQMPAWRLMDPLVVLEYLDSENEDTDDDSLQSMVDNANDLNHDNDPPMTSKDEGHTHV